MKVMMFVYGSLMSDSWSFSRFCTSAIAVGEGYVPGRLLLRHTGTPILQFDPASLLQLGSSNLQQDAAIQQSETGAEKLEQIYRTKALLDDKFLKQNTADSLKKYFVKGEWLLFDDAEETLRKLDEYEEFFADTPDKCLYDRWLVKSPAFKGPVWTYGIPSCKTPDVYSPPKNAHLWDPMEENIPRDAKTGEYLN